MIKFFANLFPALAACALLAASIASQTAVAQTPPPLDQQRHADESHLQNLEGEISLIEQLIKQSEENLAKAEAKRQETQAEATKLQQQSDALKPALTAKNEAFLQKQSALKEVMMVDYKSLHHSAVETLAEGGSLSETLSQATYINALEHKINHLAEEAKSAREDLREQKRSLDNQRSTQELLARQLASLELSVQQQHQELQELLANRHNEAAYIAERIATANRVKESLLDPSFLGTFTEGARLKQGDVVGYEGSTGSSTGCHTHFSVIYGNKWVDPADHWSVLRPPSGEIFQVFGWTEWARRGVYGGKIHSGIDYVQGCGSPVRAAADGVVIRDNRTDGSGFGHYIMIKHDDGLITLYAHLI